jgi:hypothetical protein
MADHLSTTINLIKSLNLHRGGGDLEYEIRGFLIDKLKKILCDETGRIDVDIDWLINVMCEL